MTLPGFRIPRGSSAAFVAADQLFGAGALWAELETARENGSAPDVSWHRRKDGSTFWDEVSALCLRGPDGRVRDAVHHLDEVRVEVDGLAEHGEHRVGDVHDVQPAGLGGAPSSPRAPVTPPGAAPVLYLHGGPGGGTAPAISSCISSRCASSSQVS